MNTNEQLLTRANTVAANTWALLRGRYHPIGDCPVIVLNNRLTRTLGRAWVEESKIDLSTTLFRAHFRHYLREVIPHELAHFVAWRVAGHHLHGKPWREVMRFLQLDPKTSYWFD